MSIIQRRRDNTKEKVEEIKYYEHGAHFKYIDLFKSLVNLVSILPAERLGHNGIYFQHDETESKRLNLSLLRNIRANKSLLHISIHKSLRNSPVKSTPTIKHTNTTIKYNEPRMSTFGNSNNSNKKAFRVNVRLKKLNKNKNTILLPKLFSPSRDGKSMNSPKMNNNNLTSFSKYKMLSRFRSQRNETNSIHCDTYAFENNLKMKLSIN